MALGLFFDAVGDLGDVRSNIVKLPAAVEMLGDEVHLVGTLLEHAARPSAFFVGRPLVQRAERADSDQFDFRIDPAHVFDDLVVLERVVSQLHIA